MRFFVKEAARFRYFHQCTPSVTDGTQLHPFAGIDLSLRLRKPQDNRKVDGRHPISFAYIFNKHALRHAF
jgi:hypothetical protein